ncbi:glycine-rich RNA-binding RZ1C-like isoform X1 [Olea europaea subsp. europaea]|uniref:Glycine-rich RNA-binding RZ1C-like isoform X1 n=1 Tax=Olea europaea subsp. europaea TaxID=158383 RepID=A0A8S0SAA4_OLEEU|nr:glycine-rich RNA-binding RZ1C-like isoform X1 [Olea europaea subsp. europaea]
MAGKEQDKRIFVGGLSRDITERQLEDAFRRFGKIIDSQVMLERDTGRPRGFGFLTFADRRAVEDAIKDMHGREFGDRVISVNKAQPKSGDEDPEHGYGGYSSGGRGRGRGRVSYGGDRSSGLDDCFKCGRTSHWARDCPLAGGGARPFSPPRSRYGRAGSRGDRYAVDRDRYMDDRYDRGRYGDSDRYEGRYGSRDRYPPAGDRYDQYGNSDRYPIGNGKDRGYNRDGGGGGPARYEGRNYRDRAGPYDRPRRGRPSSFDRY